MRPASRVLAIPTLAGLYGFWRNESDSPVERNPVLYLLLVPIIGLALFGAIRVLGSTPRRRMGVVLAAAGLIGLLLAAGTSFPQRPTRSGGSSIT